MKQEQGPRNPQPGGAGGQTGGGGGQGDEVRNGGLSSSEVSWDRIAPGEIPCVVGIVYYCLGGILGLDSG